jgi:hypothetical protein
VQKRSLAPPGGREDDATWALHSNAQICVEEAEGAAGGGDRATLLLALFFSFDPESRGQTELVREENEYGFLFVFFSSRNGKKASSRTILNEGKVARIVA